MGVGVQLARRNRDFLLGEQAPPRAKERIRAAVAATPGVVSVGEPLVTFVGPRQVWVLARVDVDDRLRGDQVESLVAEVEQTLRRASDYVVRVDVVPVGRAS